MVEQLTFASPVARRSDPDTSHLAAALARGNAPRHRDLALKALRAAPAGLTDFELSEATGVPQTSIGVRRHELVKVGLVERTDTYRPSPSGARAIVWRAVS
jgi:hypothetical protein